MKRGVFKSFVAVLLAVLLVVDAVPVQSVKAYSNSYGYLTDFADVSSGKGTSYFVHKNRFYQVNWLNINKDETSSIMLYYDYNYLKMNTNGIYYKTSNLYDQFGKVLQIFDIENLDENSNPVLWGYSNYSAIAVNAIENHFNDYKYICRIVCLGENDPTWDWSDDYTSCKATFSCKENPDYTTTLDAEVTTSGLTRCYGCLSYTNRLQCLYLKVDSPLFIAGSKNRKKMEYKIFMHKY